MWEFKTHTTEEFYNSMVGSIKYLFKYVCKGPDHVTVEVQARQSAESSDIALKKSADSKMHDAF